MDDKQLDKYFNEHLENFQDEGNPDPGWDKMGTMLDRYASSPSGFFISRQILWSAVAIFLLLISTFLYGIWNQQQQMNLLHSSLQEMKEELDGGGRIAASRVDTLILVAGPDGKMHKLSPESFSKLSETRAPEENRAHKYYPSYPSSVYPKNPTNLTHNSTLTNSKKEVHSPISKEEENIQPKEEKIAPSLIAKQEAQNSDSQDDESEEKVRSEEKKAAEQKTEEQLKKLEDLTKEIATAEPQKPKNQFWKKLASQLGFRSGLEFNLAAGGNQFSETSAIYGGGLGAELQIGERFALRSGARILNFAYELEDLSSELLSEDFSLRFPGANTLAAGAEFHEIKMSGAYFEVPVGLRYYHPFNRKFTAFTGFDISGGAFLNENFTYEVYNGGSEEYFRGTASNIPWNWGTARFSLGTSVALNNRWDWETALFFEKDLSTRGVEEFSYYMIGLSTSVWLKQ